MPFRESHSSPVEDRLFLVTSRLQADSARVSSRPKGQGRMKSVCRDGGGEIIQNIKQNAKVAQ